MKSLLLLMSLSLGVSHAAAAQPAAELQRVGSGGLAGTAASVRVADVPLVFTGQIFASDIAGDARGQAIGALTALGTTLTAAGSELSRVVRLVAYVADASAVSAVEAAVSARFAGAPPAFTLIRTPLHVPGARVAFEAVASRSGPADATSRIGENAAILPAGGKIFISGQAERGPDLASAVKLTMAGLHRSVAHLGLKKSDIVQVKGFIQPSGDHAVALREVAASFDGGAVPPIVLYEWVSDLFTEIEIVVSAKSLPAAPAEPITYAWLPWLSRSPRYCHVAHVMPGTPLIFIGAIDGGAANGPRAQMKTIFERLGSVLFEAGSSYRNMAKATYYLADPAARALLGDIRGVYFDPTRPPAASAVGVRSLAHAGQAAVVDMIAVPVK